MDKFLTLQLMMMKGSKLKVEKVSKIQNIDEEVSKIKKIDKVEEVSKIKSIDEETIMLLLSLWSRRCLYVN